MVEVSFFEANLLPMLTTVGWLVGYQVDDGDLAALSHGLRETDAEEGRGTGTSSTGRSGRSSRSPWTTPGGSLVLLRAALPVAFEPQVRLLGEFCWRLHWRERCGR